MLKKWKGLLFVLPSLIGVMFFYIIPFIVSFTYCFTTGTINRKFSGLIHFKELFQSPVFKMALYNTCKIIGIGLPLLILLSLAMAFVMEEKFSQLRWVQSILLIPMAIPAASLMLLWKDLLTPEGLINSLLGTHVDWMRSGYAPWIIIFMILWKNLGYSTLLIMNSLLMLPKEYVEAARLDGAGAYKIILFIKLPYLVPILFFSLVVSLFNCFKIFREVYLLQGAYPEENLYLLQHFMNNNFAKLNYERLSAAAFILYSFIFIFIFVATKQQKHYINENL